MKILTLLVLLSTAFAPAEAAADRSCFARTLPADWREGRLDDVKLLIGWVFDIAAAHQPLERDQVIDRRSGLSDVPGFAGPTDLGDLKGRYQIMRPPFDGGRGYFGLELGTLDPDGRVTSILLVNRLFRLPVLWQQPVGVLTDLVTNGAMLFGWRTAAVTDANFASETVFADAERLQVPLVTAGQSQAGGVAQLQAAYLVASHPDRSVQTGFVTLNAAYVVSSIRRLDLSLDDVQGINFVKDLDPGFGPHGLLPNRIGQQIYIHPDGSGSGVAGNQSVFAALRHPAQHLLAEFNQVSLDRTFYCPIGQASYCARAARMPLFPAFRTK